MLDDDAVDVAALRGVRAVVGLALRSLDGARGTVSIPQLRAMLVVQAKQPFLVGELAVALSISPSAATRFAARLDRDGWVQRERDRVDRRSVTLHLTPKAERLVQQVQQRRADELGAAFARMTDAERHTAVAGLALLADALQEPGDPADLAALGFTPDLPESAP